MSVQEILVTNAQLSWFQNQRQTLGPALAAGLLLNLSHNINYQYMKEQAIEYYIHGPAWRNDDLFLERAWLKGYEAALGSGVIRLRFEIDQYTVSKLHKDLIPLPEPNP